MAVDGAVDLGELPEHLTVDEAPRVTLLRVFADCRRIFDVILDQIIRSGHYPRCHVATHDILI